MSILESIELAISNILASKMRTLLTMLGIIIGVTAVIVIVGLGNGMEVYMTNSFSSMGTNSITVTINGRGASSRSISVEEMYDLVAKNPEYLQSISPRVTMTGKVKIGSETYDSTSVTGVSEDYFDMKQYTVEKGRGLQYIDMDKRKSVCVVGSYVEDVLFGGNALNQTLKVGGNTFTIVGVLVKETDGESEKGGTDDAIYVPYSSANRLNHNGAVNSYVINIVSENKASESKSIVENALYKVFDDEDAYRVISMTELLNMMSNILNIMISVLAVIAGISLVVGGIGIMNIMLVSVTERTREIGIRKALGAKERYIMTQFVIEASTTSAIGGILGIIVGYLISSLATTIIKAVMKTNLPVTPSIFSVLMAFSISAAIGILFGYLPAKKASRLNPIDALRYE
jgi:putative ABC transport system permease protein